MKGENGMDLLTSKIKPMYFRYLTAAFGSALISSIYGVVDMAMVGQYQGPEGTAALAVVAPVWNIIYSLESAALSFLLPYGGSLNTIVKNLMNILLPHLSGQQLWRLLHGWR